MDGSHYHSNVIGTSSSSYPSPAAISPHHLQNGHHLPSHTLPPLQPQNPAMQSMYGSHPHTPRTPGTSGPPTPTNNMSSYPPPPQNAGRGGYQQMMPNPYPQSHQTYGTSSSMMPQSSVAASHPQPIAPAPASRPPVLRPMPAGGVMPQSGLSSPYGQSPLMPHSQSILQQEAEQPTHVVGSQGRRGILPSAPGRPAAPTGTGAAKSTVIPQKDADGKFPCPHCTKTYLHAKHLKRHLLRHTGDRPYMCVLCRDTFSRSDILKRHFQKCSIRRGNPTGASHLSHPQAHVKKHQAAQQKAAAEGDMNQMNGMGNMQGENVVHPFGMVPMADGMPNLQNDQNQLSRSSSISRMEDQNRDRRSMTGGGSVYGGDVQSSMASNINPQLANYSMPQGQNGMQMFTGSNPNQQNLDWSMFQAGAQENTYANSFPPPNLGQTQIPGIKQEHHNDNLDADRAVPNDMNDRSLFFSNWENTPTMHDPYQYLSNQIINFFYPSGAVVPSQAAGMNAYVSPTNIKDFLEKYSHFHCHFSFLHIPTFRIMEAYTGLLASMCCVGACYSDQVSPAEVRDMMNFLKTALERDSDLFAANPNGEYRAPNGPHPGNDKKEMERLQALVLMSQLLIWNGTPVQRDGARRLFPLVADMARRSGLLRVSSSPYLYSALHQPNLSLQNTNADNFDWAPWIQQEGRIRLMHMIYLSDAAYGLYFNAESQIDSSEMHIPLPSDDAAWEAESATECAEALHLYGSEAARARNADGSQRSKQPELDLAMRALLHESYQIHPGSTNLYGKFILIHALLAQIRRAQLEGNLVGTSRSATPLSQNDWIFKSGTDAGSGHASANNSGRATPVSGLTKGISPQALKAICTALDKFKSNWDMDMAIQFPPSVQSSRRYGFSRDGIHFFYLAQWLLKHTRPDDLHMPADHRFTQVIQLLKSVKTWVMEDGAKRGEELGSVGEIDHEYGVLDLTLNMASLFRPLPQVVASPHMPTVKTEI
ncbi:fungal-specific transcription factor domain-containing protein [Xylariales sp. AK1849]|nr:fungal-specific transcription factor domain-containing protein [Xylariales sp. AK1849]